MVSKRKRSDPSDNGPSASESTGFSIGPADDDFSGSEHSVDISSALLGRKRLKVGVKNGAVMDGDGDGDNDDALEDMIRESIAKRDKKTGTEVLRKVKGKNKLVKGEVGGGSFQNMGVSFWCLVWTTHTY